MSLQMSEKKAKCISNFNSTIAYGKNTQNDQL